MTIHGNYYMVYMVYTEHAKAQRVTTTEAFQRNISLWEGVVVLRGPSFVCLVWGHCLSSLSTDTTGQLDVLGHDGDTLRVDSAQVGVLKETYEVSLRCLLQGHDGRGLEAQVGLEVLGNLSHQTLEWELADEKLSTLLVPTDLTESHCSWPVTVGLLHSSGGRGTLTSGLGGQLFARSLSSCRFTGSLLSTGHCKVLQLRMNKLCFSAPCYLYEAASDVLGPQPIRGPHSFEMVSSSRF